MGRKRRRKRKRKNRNAPPSRVELGPGDQRQGRQQTPSLRIPVALEDGGEWFQFATEPLTQDDKPLKMGAPGRYKIVFYVGSSVPEELSRDNPFLTPEPCLLKIPGKTGLTIEHPRDEGRPPEFILMADRSSSLDRIEVVLELRHVDQSSVKRNPVGAHDIGPQIAAEEEAYRRIVGWINWYSFLKRVPIEVRFIVSEDLSSGHRHFGVQAPYPIVGISNAELVEGVLVDDFVKAFGLYREALASDNPFYRLLTFFKIWELVQGTEGYEGLRPRISKALKAAGMDPGRPNEKFAAGPYAGRRYVDVIDGEVRAKYRDAMAHVTLQSGESKRPDDLADIRAMEMAAGSLHIAIREILTNEINAHQRLKEGKR